MGQQGRRSASWATCALVTLLLCPGTAWAIPVNLDCYLESGPLDCSTLDNAYFESIPGAERSSSQSADLGLQVRATSLSSGQRYSVTFKGKGEDRPEFTLWDDVPAALQGDQALNRMLALLHRGTVPFLEVRSPGHSEDGVFLLKASPSSHENRAEDKDSPWYFRPSISGELVQGSLTILSVRGDLELNRSDRYRRFLLSGNLSYRYVDFELPDDQRLRGGYTSGAGSLVLAQSLGKHFSIAALSNAQRSPQNNLKIRLEGGAGIEWLQSRFLESDEGNFGARYRLLSVHDRYVTHSVLQSSRLSYGRHVASLFGKLHQEKFDVGLDLSAGAPLHRPDLWRLGGETTLTLRVATGLELELSGYLVYQAGVINEPLDQSDLDPVATLLSGNDFAPTNYGAQVSIAYSIGNGLLRSQDQRWR
jgi:hypothetical protein